MVFVLWLHDRELGEPTSYAVLSCTGSVMLHTCSFAAAGATREFSVIIRATESSERCNLWGSFLLRATDDALELQDDETGSVLYTWPYKLLRRFGRDKVTRMDWGQGGIVLRCWVCGGSMRIRASSGRGVNTQIPSSPSG